MMLNLQQTSQLKEGKWAVNPYGQTRVEEIENWLDEGLEELIISESLSKPDFFLDRSFLLHWLPNSAETRLDHPTTWRIRTREVNELNPNTNGLFWLYIKALEVFGML